MSDNPNAFYEGGLAVATYDLFYEQGLAHSPVAGDVEFYIARAREQGPAILELGVGTGRVAIPLAQAGFHVTGVDLSPAMLAAARARIAAQTPDVAARITLVEAAMETFALGARFDLAIVPFRAFHHLATPAAQRAALGAILTHLRPGGLLVIDIFDADLATVTPGASSPATPREIVDPATGMRVRRTTIERVNDPFAQTVREVMLIETFDAAGAPGARQETAFTLRWATYNEMACMLELSGLRVEACYGDFQRGPPGYRREQIWLARAPPP
jgi:SAM-dependent methyltransferase